MCFLASCRINISGSPIVGPADLTAGMLSPSKKLIPTVTDVRHSSFFSFIYVGADNQARAALKLWKSKLVYVVNAPQRLATIVCMQFLNQQHIEILLSIYVIYLSSYSSTITFIKTDLETRLKNICVSLLQNNLTVSTFIRGILQLQGPLPKMFSAVMYLSRFLTSCPMVISLCILTVFNWNVFFSRQCLLISVPCGIYHIL